MICKVDQSFLENTGSQHSQRKQPTDSTAHAASSNEATGAREHPFPRLLVNLVVCQNVARGLPAASCLLFVYGGERDQEGGGW